MANSNPNPSSSSESNAVNDYNGNSEDTDDFAQAGNSSSHESHGGARPKIRRPIELNGLVRPTLNGRPACEEDQKVPTITFNGEDSPNGADFDSDNDDQTNQVNTDYSRNNLRLFLRLRCIH
jgi:hypothetical protein